MDAKDIRNLQEAYLEVVEKQQLDELSVNKMIAYTKKAEKNRDELNKKWDKGTATSKERKKVFDREEGEARAERKIKQKTGKNSYQMNALDRLKASVKKEEVDIYDIILSHLLDEGYADTQQSAEAIMVNMSEEWRESIVEAFHPVYGRGGEQRRTQTALQGLGKHARATDKKKLHNIPKGGTTISDRDPQGERLGTGEYDRGKGNKAKRRAAAKGNG